MGVGKGLTGSGGAGALARVSLLPPLPCRGYSPPALCCSEVCSYFLLPQVCINHSSPNLCSCTFAKVISTVHILRELFRSLEQPASASACTALSARLKMLYQSSLVLFKESAEEGKKLMKGCQASYMEPNVRPREEGQSDDSELLWRVVFLQPGHLYPHGHPNSCSAGAVNSSISKVLSRAPKILRVVTKEEEGENQFVCTPPQDVGCKR